MPDKAQRAGWTTLLCKQTNISVVLEGLDYVYIGALAHVYIRHGLRSYAWSTNIRVVDRKSPETYPQPPTLRPRERRVPCHLPKSGSSASLCCGSFAYKRNPMRASAHFAMSKTGLERAMLRARVDGLAVHVLHHTSGLEPCPRPFLDVVFSQNPQVLL